MVRVSILGGDKDYLIKEIRYRKPYFNRRFRDKIKILAYFKENHNEMLNNEEMNELRDNKIEKEGMIRNEDSY